MWTDLRSGRPRPPSTVTERTLRPAGIGVPGCCNLSEEQRPAHEHWLIGERAAHNQRLIARHRGPGPTPSCPPLRSAAPRSVGPRESLHRPAKHSHGPKPRSTRRQPAPPLTRRLAASAPYATPCSPRSCSRSWWSPACRRLRRRRCTAARRARPRCKPWAAALRATWSARTSSSAPPAGTRPGSATTAPPRRWRGTALPRSVPAARRARVCVFSESRRCRRHRRRRRRRRRPPSPSPRPSQLKHGRVAMLAALGYVTVAAGIHFPDPVFTETRPWAALVKVRTTAATTTTTTRGT